MGRSGGGRMIRARLVQVSGMWALQIEGAPRPEFTRWRASEKPARVLAAVRREFPGWEIEGPAETGWLFEVEEMRAAAVASCPLFGE